MNAHRPRAPRKHSLRGWNPGGGCRAPRDGGWGNTSNQSRVTSNYHHCHCEGARNVENVVVRLRQSSAICLRANARSAFLFTGSPRSFHSLAMTKESKYPSTHQSCHSRARGPRKYECICGVDKAVLSFPRPGSPQIRMYLWGG